MTGTETCRKGPPGGRVDSLLLWQKNQQVNTERPPTDGKLPQRNRAPASAAFSVVTLQQPQVALQHPFRGDVSYPSRRVSAVPPGAPRRSATDRKAAKEFRPKRD